MQLDPTISTHAPRTGSDSTIWGNAARPYNFNPRSPHGERRYRDATRTDERRISTHAPRTGSDTDGDAQAPPRKISTHAPRTGSDFAAASSAVALSQFQPTLPARGATRNALRRVAGHRISTHAPRTGSDTRLMMARRHGPISTHAPRTGSDKTGARPEGGHHISTHAPRTGSDRNAGGNRCRRNHFNPRSPHGERLIDMSLKNMYLDISTHAPRTGSDILTRQRVTPPNAFQPTLPARGATY